MVTIRDSSFDLEFVVNCYQEKWLCPLSGKKFKAPEFVRKHIFNKFHQEVDKVNFILLQLVTLL